MGAVGGRGGVSGCKYVGSVGGTEDYDTDIFNLVCVDKMKQTLMLMMRKWKMEELDGQLVWRLVLGLIWLAWVGGSWVGGYTDMIRGQAGTGGIDKGINGWTDGWMDGWTGGEQVGGRVGDKTGSDGLDIQNRKYRCKMQMQMKMQMRETRKKDRDLLILSFDHGIYFVHSLEFYTSHTLLALEWFRLVVPLSSLVALGYRPLLLLW
jgi:hypothetical protein